MTVTRWTFFEPISNITYEVPVNPNDGGSPVFSKNFAYQTTSAPDGQTIVFEGAVKPNAMTFSGVILTEGHYEFYKTLFELNHQLKLTDDLGREFWIVITDYEPKRVRSAHYPWKHTFDVKYVEVNIS